MDKTKRDRSANFSTQERDILVSLVEKYRTVLENKQSDAATWKTKEAAWEKIEHEFNARSGLYRSTKTLKIKYEGLKRSVRKKSAAIRSELYRTGGGTSKAPSLDSTEEKIKMMISLSADGMQSVYDSDVIPEPQGNIEVPISEIIQKYSEAEVANNDTSEIQNLLLVTHEGDPLPSTSTWTVPDCEKENIEVENENEPLCNMNNKNVVTPTTSAIKKWDATSRKNLKGRKHFALIANTNKRSQFEELTKAKMELVQLQKKFLEDEIKEKQIAWAFERTERQKESEFKEEERKLKLEILKKQLN